MPWWLPLYLLIVVTVTVFALRDDFKNDPIALTAAEIASTALLMIAGMAYWLDSIRTFLGATAPFVFVGGLSWVVLSAVREIKNLRPDPELTRGEHLVAVVVGVSIYIALHVPLIYWGYSYAYLGLRNGA